MSSRDLGTLYWTELDRWDKGVPSKAEECKLSLKPHEVIEEMGG